MFADTVRLNPAETATPPLFILASASPRRLSLLRQAGYTPEAVPAAIDESLRAGEPPRDYVRRIAAAKVAVIAHMYPEAVVLGADTTVVCAEQILGKPADTVQAAAMLRQLSGNQHQVWTGVCVGRGDDVRHIEIETTVCFRLLAEPEIAAYIASEEPMDKAGAYAIQGRGALFVERIVGSYSAVVGLPLCQTAVLLSEYGLTPWTAAPQQV